MLVDFDVTGKQGMNIVYFGQEWRFKGLLHPKMKILSLITYPHFFAYKKYSRSFVKLWLNPWCHMDYFTDLLATFLDVDRVNYIATLSMGGSESCQNASKIS